MLHVYTITPTTLSIRLTNGLSCLIVADRRVVADARTLSIPDHREVKRTIIAGLIKVAGTSEEVYLRAFGGETISDDYWVYEDMTVHTATVHRGDCQYCNHGAGMGRGRIERDSRWLGPHSAEDEIRSASIRANSMLRKCGAGPCRDDPVLA